MQTETPQSPDRRVWLGAFPLGFNFTGTEEATRLLCDTVALENALDRSQGSLVRRYIVARDTPVILFER